MTWLSALSEEQRAKLIVRIRELWPTSMPQAEMREVLGLPRRALGELRILAGLPDRARGGDQRRQASRDRVERMRELLAEGMTLSAIGKVLGISKNAVSGLKLRHVGAGVVLKPGVTGAARLQAANAARAAKAAAKPKPPPKPKPIKPKPARPKRPKLVRERTNPPMVDGRGCMYPIGEGRALHYCDAPLDPAGSSYCPTHHKLCLLPPPRKLAA